MFEEKYAIMLKNGSVGVIPTDTLYGIVASCFDDDAVERVKTLKKESKDRKGYVVLLSSKEDLSLFDTKVGISEQEAIEKLWPGPFSIIIKVGEGNSNLTYTGDIAFRIPDNQELIEFLKVSGPLIAPSANPSGLEPAISVEMAKEYFGDKVDFYIDKGILEGSPSSLIRFNDGELEVIREGSIDPRSILS